MGASVAAPLVEAHPGYKAVPDAEVNRMPSSTLEVSVTDGVLGVALPKIEQGQSTVTLRVVTAPMLALSSMERA